MQKWAYICVTVSISNDFEKHRSTPYEIRLNTKITNSRATLSDAYDYFNRLGQEGWEMVGVDKTDHYFKRPIE